ncbi:MAG: response regulator transcription factor [Leptolyngbyaceae cyanobacterium bins.59]|nr:response regulator transcription factor [Leptolyngbyaceae cyanobacterium bins.59]
MPYATVASPSQFRPLSNREREVLKLILEGASNPEIARQLYLSPNTVKTHVRSIFDKLGVEHRIQAAVVALQQGLVEPGEQG